MPELDYGTVDDNSEAPFSVTDEVDVGDLSDQQGGVLEPAAKVHFHIKKASVRIAEDKDTRTWMVKRLVVEAQIGPEGVDGEGKYARKVLFPELVLTFNSKDFPDTYKSPWWQNEARYPTKQFLKAMGEDVTSVRVNDDFLTSLIGREFIADIKRREIKTKVNGKYEGTGDFKNELSNFRSAESADSASA
jgi:hypothetical protein